ncbi:hypothetical protein VPH35_139469 [Triticum aestivum]
MVPCYCKNKDNDVGSAIEYAVCALKVEVIVVIGHSRCSGIKALLNLKDGADDTFHFVEDWVRIGFPARKKVKAKCSQMPFEDQCGVLEKEAVNVPLRQGGCGLWAMEPSSWSAATMTSSPASLTHGSCKLISPPIAQLLHIHPYMREYIISNIPWVRSIDVSAMEHAPARYFPAVVNAGWLDVNFVIRGQIFRCGIIVQN